MPSPAIHVVSKLFGARLALLQTLLVSYELPVDCVTSPEPVKTERIHSVFDCRTPNPVEYERTADKTKQPNVALKFRCDEMHKDVYRASDILNVSRNRYVCRQCIDYSEMFRMHCKMTRLLVRSPSIKIPVVVRSVHVNRGRTGERLACTCWLRRKAL